MKSIIITGCDAGYFRVVQGLIRSIRKHPQLEQHDLGFLDFGLDDSQRKWLREQGAIIKPGGWDYDFPERDRWEETRPWFKIYLCRPHLRRHFPGYFVYLWLDADAWVQRPESINHLMSSAARGGLAAVPEIDRSYMKFVTHYDHWENDVKVAIHCLGPELGQRLALTPTFNAGVFAMRHDAPHWDAWRDYLAQGLLRVDPAVEMSRMVEQTSFNAAILLHDFPTHRLPSTDNWLACLAMPAWDVGREQFVEPAPPHTAIGIMHLTAFLLDGHVQISALADGDPLFSLTVQISFDGLEGLLRGRDELMKAAAQVRH